MIFYENYIPLDVVEQITEKQLGFSKEELRRINRELKSAPKGNLRMRLDGNNRYYSEFERMCDNGKSVQREKGITGDLCRVYGLARKKLLQAKVTDICDCINILEGNLRDIRSKKKWYSENVLVDYKNKGLDVHRIALSLEQYNWQNDYEPQNKNYLDNLEYETKRGEMVRSKSEQYIANFLYDAGIPYRYEMRLVLGGEIRYPDFVILLPDGREIIWEHFGLNDREYMANNMEKLELYARNGYHIGKNLIVTFECDLKTSKRVEEIIEWIISIS